MKNIFTKNEKIEIIKNNLEANGIEPNINKATIKLLSYNFFIGEYKVKTKKNPNQFKLPKHLYRHIKNMFGDVDFSKIFFGYRLSNDCAPHMEITYILFEKQWDYYKPIKICEQGKIIIPSDADLLLGHSNLHLLGCGEKLEIYNPNNYKTAIKKIKSNNIDELIESLGLWH